MVKGMVLGSELGQDQVLALAAWRPREVESVLVEDSPREGGVARPCPAC